jgi:hypothetical protein
MILRAAAWAAWSSALKNLEDHQQKSRADHCEFDRRHGVPLTKKYARVAQECVARTTARFNPPAVHTEHFKIYISALL